MGVGEAGWWGRGDRSHQRGEELYLCCFKEKYGKGEKEESKMPVLERCRGSPQRMRKDLWDGGTAELMPG